MKALIVFLISVLVFNKSIAQNLNNPLDGVWMGTYQCAQGETGIRLTLTAITDSTFDGIYDFFPICSNYAKDVEVGKYYVTGNNDRYRNIKIFGRQWIWRPLDWFMVDLSGKLFGDKIEGNIVQQSCGNFKIIKQE